MYFESLEAAWLMGGHGPYVWSAYGITLVVLAVLIGLPIQRARGTRRQLIAELRRREAQPETDSKEEVDAPQA